MGTSAVAQESGPPPFSQQCPATEFKAPRGSWTLAVLPDTQHYLAFWPEVFFRQTEWIAANKEKHHILFVAHEGDITNDNSPQQWAMAQRGMKTLEKAGIPYAILPGNKDLGEKGTAGDRSTLMNRYFSREDYRNSKAVGFFAPGEMENSWHEFETPTGGYLLLALELGPRDEVLDWANRVVAEKPERQVIVVTHGYLYHDGMRQGSDPGQGANPKSYGIANTGSVNDGEAMWKKFVSLHRNIRLVLNGHCTGSGAARLESAGVCGNHVWQILANYQNGVTPNQGFGGGGYLRLLQFHPDGKTVAVKSYSPWYNRWLTTPDQEFVITFK